MQCKDCNFYSKENRLCVKHQRFELPAMIICNDFIKDKSNDNQ